jgi:hypothetical protein
MPLGCYGAEAARPNLLLGNLLCCREAVRVKTLACLGLIVGAAVVLLSGCGGSTIPIRAADNATGVHLIEHNKTFDYTGKEQTFIVPAGVTRLTVVARGGEGAGSSTPPSYDPPGFPGRIYAVIRVHHGEKLYVFVGGSGSDGGYNGGGTGGKAGYGGGTGNAGGGASDVRMGSDTLKDRIIVAAGGGGSGAADLYGYDQGGDGGGLSGKSGGGGGPYSGGGGTGGRQRKGGAGGAGGTGDKSSANGKPGAKGTLGSGGSGGNGGPGISSGDSGLPGGGGGGGYYGGGGGGGSGATYKYYDESQGGGGGGGSSYIEPSAITSRMWTGWREKGDGRVIFSWN